MPLVVFFVLRRNHPHRQGFSAIHHTQKSAPSHLNEVVCRFLPDAAPSYFADHLYGAGVALQKLLVVYTLHKTDLRVFLHFSSVLSVEARGCLTDHGVLLVNARVCAPLTDPSYSLEIVHVLHTGEETAENTVNEILNVSTLSYRRLASNHSHSDPFQTLEYYYSVTESLVAPAQVC